MKLGVFERIKLSSILPRKESYRTLMVIKTLRQELAFSEDEEKRLKFRGILKCTSCKMTNLEYAKKTVDEWEKGGKARLDNPTKEELTRLLTEIFKSQKCFACKAPMQNTGEVVWQRVKEKDKVVPLQKEIRISDELAKLIVKALRDLDKKKKLEDSLVSLYEKFTGVAR